MLGKISPDQTTKLMKAVLIKLNDMTEKQPRNGQDDAANSEENFSIVDGDTEAKKTETTADNPDTETTADETEKAANADNAETETKEKAREEKLEALTITQM